MRTKRCRYLIRNHLSRFCHKLFALPTMNIVFQCFFQKNIDVFLLNRSQINRIFLSDKFSDLRPVLSASDCIKDSVFAIQFPLDPICSNKLKVHIQKIFNCFLCIFRCSAVLHSLFNFFCKTFHCICISLAILLLGCL